jgi:FAD:protein FMN transferase
MAAPLFDPRRGARLSRRSFLASLGTLAGAGLVPAVLRTPRQARVDITRPALGTWVRVVARHPDEGLATRAVERAYAAVARVDAQMSIHRADSQLARVNAAAADHACAVDVDVRDVVGLALEGARRSGGIYDPTVLPLMKLYGFYGAPVTTMPADRAIAAVLDRTGWRGVTTDAAQGTLGLAHAGAGLDLGSIGKGWAVDRAADALKAAGIRHGMVDAGGNVAAFGVPEDGAEGWSIGVIHPVSRAVVRTFVLRDEAVATSANNEQYRILGGLRVGHLFDARRGRPADGHLSVSVVARDATWADMMSTSAFLLGPDRFQWPEAVAVHFVG